MVGELLERCTAKAMAEKVSFFFKLMAEKLSTGCSDGPPHAADGGDGNKELAEQQDLVRVLPHDVMADVFGRLAPRWIAASRCVCRDWCACVDARRLLRTDLLPLSFRGIFVHFYCHKFPELFARPSSTGVLAITGRLDFLPNTNTSIKVPDPIFSDGDIEDHCNGLLLLRKYVVNPATRRWDRLPPCPQDPAHPVVVHMDDIVMTTFNKYLVFDPTLSPHYEVLMVPDTCSIIYKDFFDPMVEGSRLSSSPTSALRVFSSRSGNWEWRSFVREGSVAGAFRKLKPLYLRPKYAVYWRGALYVQRNANFVVRISLSNNRYRIISPPVGMRQSNHPTRYLDRSEKGVYFAALDNYRLQVWILNESSGQTEWMLKLDKDIEPVLARHRDQQIHRSWMLKAKIEGFNSGENKKAIVKGKLQSSFHNDYAIDNNRDTVEKWYIPGESLFYNPQVRILGFHHYKEVIFLSEALEKKGPRGESVMEKKLAYHLSTSEVEDLGSICPTNYLDFMYCPDQSIKYSFSYTPCWLGEFPRNS